ncbi:MAG: hypothetical protein ACHQNV_06245 [Vicinamibacteria bacterium]
MFRFLLLVLRVVGVLVVVRMVLRGLAALSRDARPAAAGPRPSQGKPVSDLVRDRTCNTFLPRDRAVRAVISGREEHFCSDACRDRAMAAASRAS